MAERSGGYTRGARDLDFIDGNPAMDAFQQGQKIAREEEMHVEDVQRKRLTNEYEKKVMPSKLRQVEAEARKAVTGANVDEAIEGDLIRQKGAIKTQHDTGAAASSTAKAAVDTASVPADIEKRAGDAQQSTYEAQYRRNTLGSRTRLSEATAQQGEAKAAVDTQSVPFDVQRRSADATAAGGHAQTAVAAGQVAQATVPDAIQQKGPIATQQQQATANKATADATVSQATVPDRIQQEGPIRTRLQKAQATTAQATNFDKLVTHLKNGDLEAAQELAGVMGERIPQELLNNYDARRHYVLAAEEAKKQYPNNPDRQQQYLKLYLEGVRVERERMRDAGHFQPVPVNPQALVDVPGAPERPEENKLGRGKLVGTTPDGFPVYYNDTTGQETIGDTKLTPTTGRGAAGREPADIAKMKYLVDQGVAKDANEAWQLISMSKSNPANTRASIYAAALRSTFGNQAKANKIADDFMATHAMPGTMQQRPNAPAPAPPPQRPPALAQPPAGAPAGARQAPDGKWYAPDPSRPGKFLLVQ